jgi:ankyrin repeat protein
MPPPPQIYNSNFEPQLSFLYNTETGPLSPYYGLPLHMHPPGSVNPAVAAGSSATNKKSNNSNNQPFPQSQRHPRHNVNQAEEESHHNPYNARRSETLIYLVEENHWVSALARISSHPAETKMVGIQGRTPLHVAADHDAPAFLVQALLHAWPEGAERVGTSHMNPLHITCSSVNASVEIVRVLLQGCRDPVRLTSAKDVDGDTPLHAACRCGAPIDVLMTLLNANPVTVLWRDYENLNPLMRLWVRYFVLFGESAITNVRVQSDVTSGLMEAWEKSVLLLEAMHNVANQGTRARGRRNDIVATAYAQLKEEEEREDAPPPFRPLHSACSLDCPRCVVRFAMVLHSQELLTRNEDGQLPIHIAATTPIFAAHDLRGDSYTFEDAIRDPSRSSCKKKKDTYREQSVIDILLVGCPEAARERDRHGQLPLHVSIMRGKTLDEGVLGLMQAYPDALTTPDTQTNLYPFMLAASVGRRRGDVTTIYELVRSAPELVQLALMEKPTRAARRLARQRALSLDVNPHAQQIS